MRYLAIPALLTASLAAQDFVVAPDPSAPAAANSIVGLEGLDLAGRSQVLIDESWLGVANIGRTIQSISFVRDAEYTKSLAGGASQTVVEISRSPHSAARAKPLMNANAAVDPAQRQVVFSGVVSAPTSSDASSRVVSWSDPQDVVTIWFQPGWIYPGGTVCLDLTGVPVAGNEVSYWPVEGVLESVAGSGQPIGSSCGPVGGFGIAGASLVAGATAPFAVEGPENVPVAFLFGASVSAINLGVLGSPDCDLQLAPFVSVATAFDRPSGILGALPRSSAVFDLDLPGTVDVLSTSLRVQLVTLSIPLHVSNGLDITIASSAPTIGAAYVRAKIAASRGRVSTTRVPLIRFEFL